MIALVSWFPLSNVMCSGYLIFNNINNSIVSTELYPRSTKSPINIYFVFGKSPPILNSSNKSKNYPCKSPHIVTGDDNGYTFDSSISIFFISSHTFLTIYSGSILPCFISTIYLSMSIYKIFYF